MAKFSKNNFYMIIHEIEDMEAADQNIWVPIGILEIMYDDYAGIIDKYFHSKTRDIDKLWSDLNNNPIGTLTIPASQKKDCCWCYNDKPANVPCGPHDPVYPKITWTCDDILDNITPLNENSLKYKSAYNYATVPSCYNE